MEIEFNPSQMPAPRVSGTARAPATVPNADLQAAAQLQGTGELQRKLNELALTRPEKMQALRSVISDVKYPPDELLNGIAHLLAIKLND